MATPPYAGQGQQIATSNDWFSKIASLFTGSSTPAYIGAGQPAQVTSGFLRGTSTPMYAAAPVREAVPVAAEMDPSVSVATVCEMDCPIDPSALAAGQIAIVIPRERLGPQQ
ncbi:MAG: hypothetical protein AB7T06_37460 [Kofleriaceae bacterium]